MELKVAMEMKQIFHRVNNEGFSLIDTAVLLFLSSILLLAVLSMALVYLKYANNTNEKIENLINLKNEISTEYIKTKE